jgi:hypothetical protein
MPAKTARELEQMITPEIIRAGKTVFLAMAYTQTLKPVVDAYHDKVLREMGYPHLNSKTSYNLPDNVWDEYYKRVKVERDKAGLHVDNDDFCPLLVAENLECKAKRALVDLMEPITGLSADRVLTGGHALENYDKLVDITLRFLAPKVR